MLLAVSYGSYRAISAKCLIALVSSQYKRLISLVDEKEERIGGILYECVNCGSKITAEQLSMTPEIKCPICGYRILRKVRPPIVKHVKAR